MWIRASGTGGADPCLVSVDDVLQLKGFYNIPESKNRIQVLTTWSQALFSVTSYPTLADAQQAADDLAKVIAGPQIVET